MRRPRFIAKQSRHAKGALGWLIASIMARETWHENARAIEALDVEERDQVLDIGCGHGRSLGALAARARSGRVVGADPSDLMVNIAAKRNRALSESGHVEVVKADVGKLPFADCSFDKVLCVHVIYFWTDLNAGFRELARVLQPKGKLALLFRSSLDRAAVQSFPADIYRFPRVADVLSALSNAGLALAPQSDLAEAENHPPGPRLLLACKPERTHLQS